MMPVSRSQKITMLITLEMSPNAMPCVGKRGTEIKLNSPLKQSLHLGVGAWRILLGVQRLRREHQRTLLSIHRGSCNALHPGQLYVFISS